MKIRFKGLLFFILCMYTMDTLGNEIIEKYVTKVQYQIDRIDELDGAADNYIKLTSDLQSLQAVETYITGPNKIVDEILNKDDVTDESKIDQLRKVEELLKGINAGNVHFYTQLKPTIDLIQKVQQVKDVNRLRAILRSNVFTSLGLMAFYVDQPLAESFLMEAAIIEPTEFLTHYKEIDYKPYSTKILDKLASVAPTKIKTYLHSWNPVHQRIKTSEDRLTQEIYEIFKSKGGATKAYVLINDIYKGLLSIDEAHQIGKNDSVLFSYLLKMRTNETTIIGEHSVDETLTYQALKRVRLINELHEEPDQVRFASLNKYSASQIYTLMVYSEDEIYTSTFLGMYIRMMNKMDAESTYEFLHHQRFNKFRTFVKMAAGYNELPAFLSKMTAFEKKQLFNKLVSGLEHTNDNLESAVAVADTYGSLQDRGNKQLMKEATLSYYENQAQNSNEARKLYELILDIFKLDANDENLLELDKSLSDLKVFPSDRLFKEGKNIQQHFFFDDPDGKASYDHFLGTFSNGNWKVEDRETYIIISSVEGRDIEIYANKPTSEYAGQDAIRAYFEASKRWPDVVVHRGHSYFADAAIESLTPNAEIVFLGSCGGYNNIAQVLKYSPDAQIISSKQIGTMLVNDKLCLALNEQIRSGNDINWDNLWSKLDSNFINGSTADKRFQDYIPPHKNLGAVLIKRYRSIL